MSRGWIQELEVRIKIPLKYVEVENSNRLDLMTSMCN